MVSEIENTPLEELCEEIVDCPHSTPVWTEQGVVVLRSPNIKNGRLDLSNPSFTDEVHYEERSRRARIQGGDVVITREAPMGEVCLIPDGLKCCLGQRMVLLRPSLNACHGKYLLYALQSRQVQNEIKSHDGTGSTVSNLRIPVLKNLSIPTPSLSNQKAIAHVLGTLDDKIELNRKTNEILEGIAKALFKSWFVDFDPVKAKAEGRPTGLPDEISDLFPDSFEESELGEIPSGWRVTEISTLCQFISSGGTPSRKNPAFWTNGSIKWFKTGELGDSFVIDSEEHITQEGLKGSSCKLFDDGDILFALYGATVGKIGVVTSPSTSNQAAACLRPLEEVGTPFLECLLYSTRERLMNIATGAAQQNLYLGMVKEHLVVSPSCSLTSAFSNLVSPISHRRLHYLQETRMLTCLRDALLPRLISGELRVPDAEKMLEEVGI